MSTELLIVLTVVETAAVVAILALFLMAIGRTARSIADNLIVLKSDLQQVESHVGAIRPTAAQINEPLDDIVDTLPAIAAKAEQLARR